MIWIFLIGLVVPWVFYFSDLLGNNFDAHFSDRTLKKLRVNEKSFLRKIIPIKEGKIIKNGKIYQYRYYLYPRVLALFFQSIIFIFGLIILFIHLFICSIFSNLFFEIAGGCLMGIWIIYTLIMNILSQGLHI